jgi:dUTP pyrophosphatase
MVLDGRTIIDKKMVVLGDSDLVDTESQVQPNGIDLRINKLYEVHGKVQVPHEGKVQHDLNVREIEPKDNWFQIKPSGGNHFYVDFLESINVPGGWCATLITRSSLVRSGVDVVSGLWDSGFYGQLGCCLRVQAPIEIEWGARLCQVMFHQSKFNGHLYDGRYQGSNSQTAVKNEH